MFKVSADEFDRMIASWECKVQKMAVLMLRCASPCSLAFNVDHVEHPAKESEVAVWRPSTQLVPCHVHECDVVLVILLVISYSGHVA